MILRRDVLRDRLDHLRSVTMRLDRLRDVERETFLASYERQWVAERGLQLAAQALFDVGTHILAGHFGLQPSDYENVIRLLGEQAVISEVLQNRLKGLGGFRNVLVHGYLAIDAARVHDFLQHESHVFRDFAGEIDEWLARSGDG